MTARCARAAVQLPLRQNFDLNGVDADNLLTAEQPRRATRSARSLSVRSFSFSCVQLPGALQKVQVLQKYAPLPTRSHPNTCYAQVAAPGAVHHLARLFITLPMAAVLCWHAELSFVSPVELALCESHTAKDWPSRTGALTVASRAAVLPFFSSSHCLTPRSSSSWFNSM